MEEHKMYLFKRPENGVWYFRRPIPKELLPFVVSGNKQTITVSLGTKNLTEARKAHHAHWMESERVLDEARARKDAGAVPGGKPLSSRELVTKRTFGDFSKVELQTLLQRWYLRSKEKMLERYRGVFSFGDLEDRRRALMELGVQLESLERRDGAMPDYEVFTQLREIIEEAGGGVPLVKRGEAIELYLWFAPLVREGLIRLNQYAQAILETGVPPALESLLPADMQGQSSSLSAGAYSTTLDALIERFDKDSSHEHLKRKTRDEFKLVYKMLREFIGGAKPLASITREQIKDLQTVYGKLPAHYASLYPKKTMREVVELAKRDCKPPMAVASFNKRMTLLSSLFNFAVREQLIGSSPALRLKKQQVRKIAGEKSFTVDQLNIIFSGPLYQEFANDSSARFTPNHPLCPHEFWMPIFALFHGNRMEEILQLRLNDIEKKDGVNCIHIRPGEGQSVKKEVSIRDIPLHPELEKLGFLRYVEAVRKAGLDELFPEAMRGKTYGNRSHNYSKRFSRYITKIGVKEGRNQVFHSFRHTFTDGMRNARVPEDVRCRIGGWSHKTSSESGYGGRLLTLLSEELAKLKYDGLDLSHLEKGAV